MEADEEIENLEEKDAVIKEEIAKVLGEDKKASYQLLEI